MARACTKHTILTALVFALATLTHSVSANAINPQCHGEADILFVVDSSGSISGGDYQLMKDFAASLTTNFPLGPNAFQFASLVFSTTYSNEFGFTAHPTQPELANAIQGLIYFGGLTYTGAALESVRTFAFTASNGARDYVPHIAIVITDGMSTDSTDTSMQAFLLKQAGVSVIAIGVGSGYDRDELEEIASDPSLIFEVGDFDVLDAIKASLTKKICDEQNNHNGKCIKSCVGRRDGNYAACKPVCEDGWYYSCVNEYTYTMPCALAYYVDSNNRRFLARMVYNPATDTCELNSTICPRDPLDHEVVQTDPGTTNGSINNPCLSSLDSCHGRPDGNYPMCYPDCQAGFYITCSNGEAYRMPCALGWYVDGNNQRYLARMVYDPATDTCELTAGYCPRDPHEWCDTNTGSNSSGNNNNVVTEICHSQADILFILDSSGSIGEPNFGVVTFFVADLSTYFPVGPDDVQFSAIVFSNDAQNEFNFDTYNTNAAVGNALKNIQYIGAGTNTAAALNIARVYSFSFLNGARQNVGKVAIVVTDGVSNSQSETAAQAALLKSTGVTVIAVGVGSYLDVSELHTIASSPDHVFMVNNFTVLNAIRDALVKRACDDVTNITDCISNSCRGKPDGNYAACSPECKDGYYYSCVSEFAYKMPCGLAYYIAKDGRRFNARLVFNPSTNTCELESKSCPRDPEDHEVIPPTYTNPVVDPNNPTCISAQESCKGKRNGNYAMCYPDCQGGFYYSCSNGETYEMPCALGWYTSAQGHRFTARMVYDPSKDSCELTASYCPRTLTGPDTTTIKTTTPVTTSTTTPTIVHCDDKADLLFIMDSSGSIGRINFELQKAFVANLSTSFTLGPQKFQISNLVFSDSAFIDFAFDSFYVSSVMWQALLGAPYFAGNTDTAEALELARKVAFTPSNGARPATSKIAVVLTDGVSNYPADTAQEADALKRSGVTVIVIAIGSYTRQSELEAIATSPSHIFKVNNFDVLDSIRAAVVTTTCQGASQSTACFSGTCNGKPDGNYQDCGPDCKYGYYYSCSSGNANRMRCGLTWYQDSQGSWFTAHQVYDPVQGSCQSSSPSCPRNPEDYKDG